MRELWNSIKALLVCASIFAAFCALLHMCGVLAVGCSPVNVQVQQCTGEVRDSSGVTFYGCRADGNADAEGTLRVNLKTPEGEDNGDPAGHAPGNDTGLRLALLN